VRLAPFLAVRLLRRKGTALLRSSAVAALVAVVLGTASLVVVLAIMSGYSAALRNGLLASFGHIIAVFPRSEPAETLERAQQRIASVPGVVAAGGIVLLPGMLQAPGSDRIELITLRAGATSLPDVKLPAGDVSGPLPIAVGRGVARRLGILEGSLGSLQIVVGRSPRAVPVRAFKVFHTGFSEVDEQWVLADLDAIRRRVAGLAVSGIEVRLRDPDNASMMRERIEAICGPRALVATWQETNSNLFAALTWQKLSLAVVLSLVLGVAAFEVAAALVVLVTEKRRSIGVLLALGSTPALVRRTLLLVGATLGGVGVLSGIGFGLLIVGVLSALGIPRFPPDIASIYMVDRIPLLVLPGDLAIVVTLSLAEVLLASLLPARRAAMRDPAEVLRWV
jgi:lipoprotein-releasing system permease protein